MKKKIKSFEEFESRFKNQALPEVHYKERLLSKIIESKKTPLFVRTSFISIFLTLFITASIATAMQFTGWTFFNSEGKQVFEMKTMNKEEAEPHWQYDWLNAKYSVAMENSQSTIAEGEFKYFLTVEGYEKIGSTALALLMNANEIESVTQIPNEFMRALLLKDNLQNKYELTTGTISNYPQHDIDGIAALAEEMYSEAKSKGVKYIERNGILSSEISTVELWYSNKDKDNPQGVRIRISSVNEEMLTSEGLEGYTRLTEDEIDYLYSEESQNIFFIKEDNNRKLLVSITYTFNKVGTTIEKSELLTLAKSLLN